MYSLDSQENAFFATTGASKGLGRASREKGFMELFFMPPCAFTTNFSADGRYLAIGTPANMYVVDVLVPKRNGSRIVHDKNHFKTRRITLYKVRVNTGTHLKYV